MVACSIHLPLDLLKNPKENLVIAVNLIALGDTLSRPRQRKDHDGKSLIKMPGWMKGLITKRLSGYFEERGKSPKIKSLGSLDLLNRCHGIGSMIEYVFDMEKHPAGYSQYEIQ